MRWRKAGFIAAAVLAIGAIGIPLLPWAEWARLAINRALAAQHVVVESYVLEGWSLNGVQATQVNIASPVPVTLGELTLGFHWDAVWRRDCVHAVQQVTIKDVVITAQRTDEGWALNGAPWPPKPSQMPPAEDVPETPAGTTVGLPPLPSLAIEGAMLSVVDGKNIAQIPLTLTYTPQDDGSALAILTSAVPHVAWNGHELDSPSLSFKATMQPSGAWEAALISSEISGKAGAKSFVLTTPSLTAEGTQFAPQGTKAVLDIAAVQLSDVPPEVVAIQLHAECALGAALMLNCNQLLANTPTQTIGLKGTASLPITDWQAARVALDVKASNVFGGTASVAIRSAAKNKLIPLQATVGLQKLSLQLVLAAMAEGKVSAEGTVSGHLPVQWLGGEKLRFGDGELRADAPGKLMLSPELLGGDNEQITFVSGILENFEYTELVIALGQGDAGGLKARLSTLGNNPKQLEGRPVKLNVNLSGDLLETLRYSILPVSDPRQWLQQQSPKTAP